jgi:endoglucanase
MGRALVRHGRVGRRVMVVAAAACMAFAANSACATAREAAPASPAAKATPAGYVRVNQVGYPDAASKRAYYMTGVASPSATFSVRDAAGTAVLSGTVGPSLGSWSSAFGFVYPLDFSALAAPGRYTIAVSAGGSPPAVSPAFDVGAGHEVYGPALRNTLRFYQNERDGWAFVPSSLRTAPAHLHDAWAMTYRTPKVDGDGVFRGDLSALGRRVDARGGWWYAGDYLKFVHATSYAEAVLLVGVRDYPEQMGAASPASDFTAEVAFGARWLLRMWDDRRRVFYYQVGIGSGNARTAGDHDIWRLPQRDDHYRRGDPVYRYIRHRPVFRLGPPGSPISPNLAGRDAAALALAAQVFRGSDPGFARRCLRAAKHIFDLADPHPRRLVTAIPYDYYPETEWRDDMEFGATELYLALTAQHASGVVGHDAAYYLEKAAYWAGAYIAGPNDAADTLNLYDVSGLAHYELYRALEKAGDPTGLAVDEAAVLADLRKSLDKAVAVAAADPFEFGYGWAQWDTTAHGTGLAVMASEYDELTGGDEYAAWSSRWLGAVLGANAWGTSFIVGDGTTFPRRLQHQVANLRGTLTGRPPILLGASVEGPNSEQASGRMPGMRVGPDTNPFKQFDGAGGAKWRDAVQNYPNTEPAIDLTAPSALAFARMIAGRF